MAATFWMMLTLALIPLVYGAGNNPEIQALDAFRKSLVDPDNRLRNWDTSLNNPCTWRFIGCDTHNRVIELSIWTEKLSGQLVPELAQLSALMRLTMS
ncbi:hypothetical protein M0R45_014602 [Rubus argutus]|uniref:Leucine-rich repeat-containing N-terminal plant-type domain-containing protein n=1 Tax=Rubus argutus TaxID=59490 RepID=A0AAW1XNA4_RUBAR